MIDEAMPMDAAPDQGGQPDGGNPEQMIGYIPEEYPAKEKTYLAAAKQIILRPETAQTIKGLLSRSNDAVMPIAAFIGKIVDKLETKLGPLQDDEHDRVCLVIAGWMASTMQSLGMPGMDDAGARQDFIGRVLTQLDQMQQGEGQGQAEGQQEAPQQGEPEPAAPMQQFGG